MIRPMKGVRVLEVAQFTFIPAAGAVLADWGADVIKVEHAERGDAQRGLSRPDGHRRSGSGPSPVMEHPNRGKRSIGLALEQPGAARVLHELVRTQRRVPDQLPARRRAAGSASTSRTSARSTPTSSTSGAAASAPRGPEARKAATTAPPSGPGPAARLGPPRRSRAPVPGCRPAPTATRMGGMTIAGGIAAALFARAAHRRDVGRRRVPARCRRLGDRARRSAWRS